MMINHQSRENFDFDKERLATYVNIFSFPRLAGTEGERKAVNLTVSTFKEKGFETNQIYSQNFDFSTFYSKVMIKIIILMNLIFVSVILLIKLLYRFLTFISILILLIIFFSMLKALKHPELKGFWEKYFGKFFSATNVFVKIPAINGSTKKVGNIIVSAHLDSKSQTFKTFWRIIFARLWLFSEIILFLFYAIYLIDYHFLTEHLKQFVIFVEILILISTILTVISNFLLLILRIGNNSRGSLDNATGMSIVFELSNFFKNHPLDNFNLWFCQFSAEELGTMGSREFLDLYEDEFSKDYTYQINFDMVSDRKNNKNLIQYIKSYGLIPPKKISPILSDYFKKAAKIEKVEYNGFHVLLGAHTDSVPFHLRKFDSIDITTKSAANYTHSLEDTPDKVDFQILLEACKVTQLLIILLDKNLINS
ncbi:MAG: M28 family metallopeptidase [Candidatus Thorarchaeota archaeon]